MTAYAFGIGGDMRLTRGLASKAKRQQTEKEKAKTQPRPQEDNATTTMLEDAKDISAPVQRIRMR